MNFDDDIKIVGDKPSDTVRQNRIRADKNVEYTAKDMAHAKRLGQLIAEKYIDEVSGSAYSEESFEVLSQIKLLLSFTATVGFERFCKNDTLSGLAQKSFIDTLSKKDEALYKASSDMGAFSFYYLAFRRSGDIERRMGQTFAMLCSRDGDPIFQERGEALYCWFSSVIRKNACELSLDR